MSKSTAEENHGANEDGGHAAAGGLLLDKQDYLVGTYWSVGGNEWLDHWSVKKLFDIVGVLKLE